MAKLDSKKATFTSGEALARNRFVKLNATARTVVYADAGDQPIGVTRNAVASGELVEVDLLEYGTVQVSAAAAVAVNSLVSPAADGQVDDTAEPIIGVALQAAADADELIEILPLPKQALPDLKARSNTETLTGAKTLTTASPRIQVLDPGGAGRDVNLPAEASSAGLEFVIVNNADAAEVLTVKDDGGTTIVTPTQNETAHLWCDGTTWFGLVGDAA